MLLMSFASEAQVVIRSNRGDKNVKTVSSTVVKREVIYKERKLHDVTPGFQQFVELSPKVDLDDFEKGHTGINYIGGWRFNNWLFVGAGTGLEFAHNRAYGMKQLIGNSETIYSHDDCYNYISNLNIEDRGSANLVSIPLYAHIRTYYMRTTWAPYSSVSLGGRLAPKDSGIYFDFSTGVDYRVNEKLHAFFSIGFWLSEFIGEDSFSGADEYYSGYNPCGSRLCPYSDMTDNYGNYISHYHIHLSDLFNDRDVYCGLSFRLGVSF